MPITMYGNMLFQSTGQGKIATFLAALRSGIILIPLLFLLIKAFGLIGLELAQAGSEVISALICLPFFHLFYRHLPEDGKEWSGL